jgi:hypothetical protein
MEGVGFGLKPHGLVATFTATRMVAGAGRIGGGHHSASRALSVDPGPRWLFTRPRCPRRPHQAGSLGSDVSPWCCPDHGG